MGGGHPADDLILAIERLRAPVCVGLDPVVERLPREWAPASASPLAAASAIESFSKLVLDAVAGIVPAVKFQSACYERMGSEGVAALDRSIDAARERGLIVVLDVKRGDIGISAQHYAAAALGSDGTEPRCDWVTLSGYLGTEAWAPFVPPSRRAGAFVLVRTSNPSGDALQSLRLGDGRTIAEAMADLVAEAGKSSVGECGYSALGAVVGATKRQDAERLRARMPQQIFLVPGYGAQGGSADDVRACFDARGQGAIVTASRSVIYPLPSDGAPAPQWSAAIREAARKLADDISRVAQGR